ncbi:MAG: threonine synthase, partial [Saprospiraceae bacterium]|nr:threonine synthase [Saprospiraceae bacterium]
MKYYSTKNKSLRVDLKTAVLHSLPADNGLYMPVTIKVLDKYLLDNIDKFSFQELSYNICHQFLKEDLSNTDIDSVISSSINFDAPVIHLSKQLKSLELWHGPSLAFKDFGARFMAALMSKLVAGENKTLDILVATSGDTGGAVASGFFNVPNINVTILYPSGKVSYLQEKQLTTLGKNIKALEINGTFDDCQGLVRKAFLDKELNTRLNLSSANSINIARLIPQTFYYFQAYKQIEASIRDQIVFCIPSGNFGNLTAGLLAKKMGLNYAKLIAATNINNVVPKYLETGDYNPIASFSTISNAMDVGNPSNFQRMLDLFDHDSKQMRSVIVPFFYDDDATRKSMKSVKNKYNYTADPHG